MSDPDYDLFDPPTVRDIAADDAEADDLSIRITQFLNRWTWRRQDLTVIRAELEQLIAEARKS